MTECESTFADGLCADLAGEVVETAEKVPVYLLQVCASPHPLRSEQYVQANSLTSSNI